MQHKKQNTSVSFPVFFYKFCIASSHFTFPSGSPAVCVFSHRFPREQKIKSVSEESGDGLDNIDPGDGSVPVTAPGQKLPWRSGGTGWDAWHHCPP